MMNIPKKKEFEGKMANNLCLTLKAELSLIISFLGGIVSINSKQFEFQFNDLLKDFKEKTNKEIKYSEQQIYRVD